MARIRTIKPGFFRSEDVSVLPLRARLTWIGLWTQCDDHGRTKDNVRLIKGDLWPLDEVSLRDIEEDLTVLAAHGRIVRYHVDGKRYLAVVNWHRHQAINRKGDPKHPAPPDPTGTGDGSDPEYCKECAASNPDAEYSLSPHGTGSEDGQRSDGAVSAGQPTHAQLTEPSVNAHAALTPGREGNRERKGGDARAGASRNAGPATTPGLEPPRTCPKHENDPEPPPCGACADARRRWETWDRQQRQSDAAGRSSEAKVQAQARAAAVRRCDLCDDHGYLPNGRVCPHKPPSRGGAAAREALDRALAEREEVEDAA